jgi:hypothetical protein
VSDKDTYTFYRCDRCGRMAYPPMDEPYPISLDDEYPREDCGCYMGPRWVRYVAIKMPLTAGSAQ